MNISYNNYNDIKLLVEKFINNDNYELEARIQPNNIDYYKFKDILCRLTLPLENGGMNLKYNVVTTLDITNDINNIRLIINNDSSIKKFWLKNNLDFINSEDDYKYLEKERLDNKDIIDYNLRFSISKEIKLNKKDNKVIDSIKLLNNEEEQKLYRYKNRYEIYFNKDFRIDMTSVRTSRGYTFKDSRVLNENSHFEIEVEALTNKSTEHYIINSFIEIFSVILSIYNNFYTLISESEKNTTLENYKNLINSSNNNNYKRNAYNNNYKNNFIAANPVTLHIKNIIKSNNIINIYQNYAISPKADGERNFLYIDSKNANLYLINNNFNVRFTGYNAKGFENTLIEGEYVNSLNLLLCYDILYFKNTDCRNKQLYSIKNKENTRLGILNTFIKGNYINFILNTLKQDDAIKIKLKEFEFTNENNVFLKSNELFTKIKNKDLSYLSDGLIYTPINDFYPKKGGSWKSLFKWKPTELNSIDFFVKIEKIKNKDIIQPIIINSDESNKKSIIKQYKILKLYVSASNDKYNINKKGWNKNIIKKLFDPYNNNDESNKVNRCFVIIDNDNKIYTNDPINNTRDEILDETIVEFVYDSSKTSGFSWIPIRVRHDKTNKYRNGENEYGNFETTANDIWESIRYPVTDKMITTGNISDEQLKNYENKITNSKPYYNCIKEEYNPNNRLSLQHFHNIWIKKNLIYDYSPSKLENSEYPKGKLLDLACGKGGDLSKWKNAKFKEVISLDIDKSCVEYAINFFKTYPKPKPTVRYAWADTSKLIFPNQDSGMNNMQKKRLKEYITNKFEFDMVSCQFCIHYYFENELKFRTLLQNVSDNLKIGGYFIGTCFNGKKIYDSLYKKKEIDGIKDNNTVLWKIIKEYKTKKLDINKPSFGMKINVYIESIGNSHDEYLVNFDYFKKELVNYGFELIKHESFEKEYEKSLANNNIKNIVNKMTNAEKELSFLNDLFVFKKIKNTPDKYYQDLTKLIKKNK